METYHIPALLKPTTEGLNIKPDGTYVDLTYGGGGHSREILARLGTNGRLIVFDQDEDAWENRIDDGRLIFVRHNFRFLYHFLKYIEMIHVDGILADLGVSSHHFDVAERGFSFRLDGLLDMRMNRNATVTAATVLNSYSEEQLAALFRIYGEITSANRLAREIVACRAKQPIHTTAELKDVASKFAPARDAARFLSQVFQALRIEVNGEMDALKEMMDASVMVLKKGGRLAIISYHSLEDRMVKNFFRTGDVNTSEPETDIYGRIDVPFKAITRKVIVPNDDEIEANPRVRSAKLRIAEKL
ncbi:MAG: 16S rRNA (cytosine(1402)-N(4))-methyltransferase RsmH [Cytophagaceae bacterium]|jgi:16S rRNA (cytosine1402-N4)-methyltransferase|nr:16S rRNA (cytosine(1402)-N(4))-methyltransferase RsmH [Cytophagaceae bacterium]